MTALIALFHSLSKTLDDVVRKVDADLPLADDIHPAIHKAGEYAAKMVRLPVALAKLEAQKVSAEACVPLRDAAVRKARHTVVTLEAKLKKLGESIDRNRAAASNEAPTSAPKAAMTGFAATLPATRQDIIEGLRKEFLGVEDEIVAAKEMLKRAEAFRKGVETRKANLAKEIAAAKKAIVDHAGRLEETIKVLRKAITHLQNRQQKRDRKRSVTAIEVVNHGVSAVEAPKAPSDEDIRKMAEAHGLSIDGPEDLEVARQLFLN